MFDSFVQSGNPLPPPHVPSLPCFHPSLGSSKRSNLLFFTSQPPPSTHLQPPLFLPLLLPFSSRTSTMSSPSSSSSSVQPSPFPQQPPSTPLLFPQAQGRLSSPFPSRRERDGAEFDLVSTRRSFSFLFPGGEKRWNRWSEGGEGERDTTARRLACSLFFLLVASFGRKAEGQEGMRRLPSLVFLSLEKGQHTAASCAARPSLSTISSISPPSPPSPPLPRFTSSHAFIFSSSCLEPSNPSCSTDSNEPGPCLLLPRLPLPPQQQHRLLPLNVLPFQPWTPSFRIDQE